MSGGEQYDTYEGDGSDEWSDEVSQDRSVRYLGCVLHAFNGGLGGRECSIDPLKASNFE